MEGYISAARTEMTVRHGSITDAMAIHLKRAERAATRGGGPGKQATELPLPRLAELWDDDSSLVPDGPAHVRRFPVVASWWLLRELEASTLPVAGVSPHSDSASVHLASSKTDQSGRGTTRTLSCTCEATPVSICPFRVVAAQAEWASTLARAKGFALHQFPLFPTAAGCQATKAAVSQTTLAIAGQLGLRTHIPNGAPRFSGHSYRATGAVHLASSGIDI